MALFRLLHFSDPHFCIWPDRQNWGRLFRQSPSLSLEQFSISLLGFPSSFQSELAETAARIVFEQKDQFDLIVLSGDLATTGQPENLRVARDFTHGMASNRFFTAAGKPTLVADADRKLLIPGNHDRFRDIFGASAGPHFDLVFDAPVWSPPIASRVLARDGNYLAVIAADFCLRRDDDAEPIVAANRAGRGKVYADTLDKLITRTRELQSKYPQTAAVWVVHFPPTDTCASAMRLIGAESLENAAEQTGVRFFMAGHLHRNVEHRTRHARPILCAGTMASSGGDDRNWFHRIEIEVDGGEALACEKVDFRWDDDEGDFVPSEGRQISLKSIL